MNPPRHVVQSRFLSTSLALLLVASLLHSIGAFAAGQDLAPTRYTVSLAHPAEHLVHVRIQIPPGPAERELQLPVWNALYQVRDFAQYVNWIRARNIHKEISITEINKSRWKISDVAEGGEIEYELFANQPGPYGAELRPEHAFFNLAEILMYPVDERSAPVEVSFQKLPADWKLATALPPCSPSEDKNAPASPDCVSAANYDRLVDGPVELGTFAESDFEEGGGHYRIVVDADPGDYNMDRISTMVRRVVAAATSWMNDRPFDSYLFIYHFPHQPVYGGMEHAYSTAITLAEQVLADDPQQLADVTAHEFFHLWNVKRIRPQSLEPVDFTQANYTPSLWFSEGVTSTAEDYILLRAGLLDEPRYLSRLGDAIAELEGRPAHLTQSAEESSLDAWLEKYSYYNLPQRSISYYNKGELLGTMLDLAIRKASHGTASLRELFQWMNQNYAKPGKFFPDAAGVRAAAEAVSHADMGWFFQKYVSGTDEIPWDDFFRTVGLHVVEGSTTAADLGFTAARAFDSPPAVTWVEPGSEAERAGLQIGDFILQVDGHTVAPNFQRQVVKIQTGDVIHLRVRGKQGERDLHWTVGSRTEISYVIKDMDHVSAEQKSRRAAWLRAEAEP